MGHQRASTQRDLVTTAPPATPLPLDVLRRLLPLLEQLLLEVLASETPTTETVDEQDHA